MAGFIDRFGWGKALSATKAWIKKLSSAGMVADDMVIRNSKAIGVTEGKFGNQGNLPEDFLYSLAMADIGNNKYIPYFDKDYAGKREYLRRFALNAEIEFMTDTVANEAIVYNEANFFCDIDTIRLKKALKDDKQEEVIDTIKEVFKKLYIHFQLANSQDAWKYFKQFLIDGALAFEIIYNDEQTEIIGWKRIDALSIRPQSFLNEEKKYEKGWVQYEEFPQMKRMLYDHQIIFISFADPNMPSRVSYIERMVRSLNLLRIIENSRVIWHLMNSSYRMKMVIPVGDSTEANAMASLGRFLSMYKEDIAVNFDSGEVSVNGQANLQFYKNYIFPSFNGESPEISVIGGEGPDLSDTGILEYFWKKLKDDSQIPYSRYDKGGGVSISFSAEGMDREEIQFYRFINRLRSIFQEILIKPVWLQMCLKFKELVNDEIFKASLALNFNKDNLYEEMKRMDIIEKRSSFINNLMQIMDKDIDADGNLTDIPFFDPRFAAETFLGFDEDDLKLNEKYKKIREERNLEKLKELKKQQAEAENSGGGMGF